MVNGDLPLLRPETLRALLAAHRDARADATTAGTRGLRRSCATPRRVRAMRRRPECAPRRGHLRDRRGRGLRRGRSRPSAAAPPKNIPDESPAPTSSPCRPRGSGPGGLRDSEARVPRSRPASSWRTLEARSSSPGVTGGAGSAAAALHDPRGPDRRPRGRLRRTVRPARGHRDRSRRADPRPLPAPRVRGGGGRIRGSLRPHPPGEPRGGAGQGRQLRRAQEDPPRRGLEGAAPLLPGRRHDRARGQHRARAPSPATTTAPTSTPPASRRGPSWAATRRSWPR